MSESLSFVVTETDFSNYKRLDQYLNDQLTDLSRNSIKKLFEQGAISSDCKLELKKMPAIGTKIDVLVPTPAETDILPQNIPLEILFEDEYLIVINKAAGMVVHPAPGNYEGTLVNAILFHCQDLKGVGHEKRPGIVHRLDKGTSGVMVVAKEAKTHAGLVDLFQKHDIQRQYQALILGNKIQDQTLTSTIGRNPNNRLKMQANVRNGKKAITHLKVLDYFGFTSHVQLTLETGRTHQIRVHLSQLLNTPIINDSLYGQPKREQTALSSEVKTLIKNYEHPMLHAKILGFTHPITREKLYFEQEPPEIFLQLQSLLNQESSS
jgi:23S rRNA pseudouridine1911/1915/1917 synthase